MPHPHIYLINHYCFQVPNFLKNSYISKNAWGKIKIISSSSRCIITINILDWLLWMFTKNVTIPSMLGTLLKVVGFVLVMLGALSLEGPLMQYVNIFL